MRRSELSSTIRSIGLLGSVSKDLSVESGFSSVPWRPAIS